LPPRGSVRAAVLEEMVYRERTRSWKRTVIELLTVAVQTNKSPETFSELSNTLNDFYNMVVHAPEAYDLNKITRSTTKREFSKSDLMSKLEGIPDV
tara:strand:- start:386 stop:673 length:288 start_codon:yes stop_codon:yes gene_type:complete